MRRTHRGFTLIELMIVVAIIGILATLALPSYQDRVIRAQVGEASNLAELGRNAVQAFYAKNRRMPRDNGEAGLPEGSNIVGNYVTRVAVAGGAVVVTFGNRVNANIEGKRLTWRPAVMEAHPVVPIAWVCGNATAPAKMKLLGENDTTLANPYLPIDCR